jgi:hypothetical protein
MMAKFCVVASNICGCSLLNFMSLLWHKNFEMASSFWKICAHLILVMSGIVVVWFLLHLQER